MTEKAEVQTKQEDQVKTDDQAKQTKGRQAKADDGHLVAMRRDGDTIKVHPTCVADHMRLGWTEA